MTSAYGLVDPVQRAVPGSFAASPGLPRLAGATIALVENTKPGASALLRHVGSELERRFGCTTELLAKADPNLMGDAMFHDLSARFRGIVTGLGD